ncbi:hypothetical protein PGTUg99_020941 [Puccinia graminis f. sp. tritici]|uniref:Uncharacterized protein n=1 Tax=Puccinia graminis f. sp. tritici TaxID=56615 RepID=A0A5B0MSA6_PUCGR|nr:hypothetical protein PGTUg99_020941 [Puccinia graminis f. sp. tritici]
MLVDLQLMTWNHFQGLIIEHQKALSDLLTSACKAGELYWHAIISGNIKFSQSNSAEISGHLAFLDFAVRAYNDYPNKVVFKIVMREPLLMAPMENLVGNNQAVQGGLKDQFVRPKTRVKPTKKKALDVAPTNRGIKGGQVQDRMGILDTTASKDSGSGASLATAIGGQSSETQGKISGNNPKKRALEFADKIKVLQGPNRPRMAHGHTYHQALWGPEPPAMELVWYSFRVAIWPI